MNPAAIATIAKMGIPLVASLIGSKQNNNSGNDGQAPRQVQQDPFIPNQMQRLRQQNYENTRMGMTDNPYYQQFLASQMQLPMIQQFPMQQFSMQQPSMQSMKRF